MNKIIYFSRIIDWTTLIILLIDNFENKTLKLISLLYRLFLWLGLLIIRSVITSYLVFMIYFGTKYNPSKFVIPIDK